MALVKGEKVGQRLSGGLEGEEQSAVCSSASEERERALRCTVVAGMERQARLRSVTGQQCCHQRHLVSCLHRHPFSRLAALLVVRRCPGRRIACCRRGSLYLCRFGYLTWGLNPPSHKACLDCLQDRWGRQVVG